MKKESNKTNFKIALLTVLCVFFAVTAVFSGFQVMKLLNEYKKSEKSYDDLLQYVVMPSPPSTPSLPSDPADGNDDDKNNDKNDNVTDDEVSVGGDTATETATETAPPENTPNEEKVYPIVDFEALAAINEDIVGWIYIDGTNINYPIVQGKDNDHYLHYTFEGEENRVGSIFMDYRCSPDFSDRNTVVYGHRLSNKTMFTALKEYKKQAFYDAHPTYMLITPENNYTVEIFSGYISTTKEEAWRLDFASDEEFSKWLEETRAKSMFKSDVIPNANDKIITLSTCTYEFDNARYILVGVISQH